MEREITTPVPLLGKYGNLLYPGWARRMLVVYNRGSIADRPLGLKEWDYYQFSFGRWVLQMTIGHISYVADFAAVLFNVDTGEQHQVERMEPLPLRRLNMPSHPDRPHRLEVKRPGFEMSYLVTREERCLTLATTTKAGEVVDIELHLPQRGDDEMVIVTPFARPTQFYLNCKVVYFGITGHVRFGDLAIEATGHETGLMDWGRGVWPFHQEWYWGCGGGWIGSDRFGFNIGWGFGDLSYATENMFFWNGTAHKVGKLVVSRDENDYMAPWTFASTNGDFRLVMTPIYDFETGLAVGPVNKHCHQINGLFNGHATLPNGQVIEITDLFAFCEHAVNNW